MNNPGFLQYEFSLYWLAVTLYIGSTVFFVTGIIFDKSKAIDLGLKTALVGLLPHATSILIRWYASGHGPYLTKFESISSSIWIAVAFYGFIALKMDRLKAVGVLVLPISFLLLGMGIMVNPEIEYLPASFQTIWLIFHIFFNKLALGAILIALGCSIFYLLKTKNGNKGFYAKLPDLATLDIYSYNFCGFCYVFWTITVIAGSIWAHKSWGRYWAWDPIETWSIITWLIFGVYMHLRRFHGLKERKAAIFMIGCFIMIILTLFLVPFITNTVHTEYLI